MVGIAEAFALLFLGLVAGITSTIFDIVVFGQASFMNHFALWALFNALVAIHVDSRLKAIWWAIPFNLGYIECYYLCTAASYEGYPRSLVVTLAALALVSPLIAYPFWTAKRDTGPYGKILSIIIAGAVMATSYYLYQGYDVYSIVVSIILLFVLLFWPARRLKFVPTPHPVTPPEPMEEHDREPEARPRSSARRRLGEVPRVEAQEKGSSGYNPSSQGRQDSWSYTYDDWSYASEMDERVREYPQTISRGGTTSRSSRNRSRSSRPTRRTSTVSRPSTRRNRQRRYERDREAYRSEATRRRERRTRGARGGRYDVDYFGNDVSSSRRSRSSRPTRRVR